MDGWMAIMAPIAVLIIPGSRDDPNKGRFFLLHGGLELELVTLNVAYGAI